MSLHKTRTVVPYCVPKGITHLMMWIGSVLPKSRKVRPMDNKDLSYTYQRKTEKDCYIDYVETLKKECEKMKAKGETCILVYSRSFINIMDVVNMNRIIDKIENCYLVEYEEFVNEIKTEDTNIDAKSIQSNMYDNSTQACICKKTTEKDFIEHIHKIKLANIQKINYSNFAYDNSLGNLVDCMRMLLLAHPSKLKQVAIQSYQRKKYPVKQKDKLDTGDFSLLYHDFDMIQINTEKTELSEQGGNFDKEKSQLIFLKIQEKNSKDAHLENGLILANSPKDKNVEIEQILFDYMNTTKVKGMYHTIISGNRTVMNCNEQWKDEGHRSWYVKPQPLEPIISNEKDTKFTPVLPKIDDYKINNKNKIDNNKLTFEQWLKKKNKQKKEDKHKTKKQLQRKCNNCNIIMHRHGKYELKSNNKVSSIPSYNCHFPNGWKNIRI